MTKATCVVFLLCAFVACCVLGVSLPSLDCSKVLCPARYCQGQYRVPGVCCPQCPDCSNAVCPAIFCSRPIYLPGRCCPLCLFRQDHCENIACIQRYCEGQYTPPGACCPVCPPNGGTLA